MNVYDAIMSRRSIRKFEQKPIAKSELKELVEAAIFAPTGANRQPLSFGIITEAALLDKIFPLTSWAGYLKGTYSPSEDKHPTAYIAVFADKENQESARGVASGAAVENMLILAQAKGIGSCWLGALKYEEIEKLLGVSEDIKLLYLIALGYPAETPKVCEYTGDVKYFIDEDGNLTVPKKTLEQTLILDK